MKAVKQKLAEEGREVQAAENCGMDREKLYRSAEEIPDGAGYFSVVISS